jgi:hypothetical protein
VIQIKPQLEKLLNLTENSLTKEIRLTQDLLELFIQYQIPSDLLSYGGGSKDKEVRLDSVKGNVRSVQLLVDTEKLKELLGSLDAAEKKAYEALVPQVLVRHNVHCDFSSTSSVGRVLESCEEKHFSARKGSKVAEAKQKLSKREPDVGMKEIVSSDEDDVLCGESRSNRAAAAPVEGGDTSRSGNARGESCSVRENIGGELRKGTQRSKVSLGGKQSAVAKSDKEKSDYEARINDRIATEREAICLRNAQREATRLQFLKKREDLQKRRLEIVTEVAAIEEARMQSNDAIVALSGRSKSVTVVSSENGTDYTKILNDLDAALEKLDLEGALRPAIINVGKIWNKRSQKGLLSNPTSKNLTVAEQKLEKQACFDLLDGLTKSGSALFGIDGAALHIVVSTTHCFEKNVMDTLVRDNVNPIAK